MDRGKLSCWIKESILWNNVTRFGSGITDTVSTAVVLFGGNMLGAVVHPFHLRENDID